MRHKISKPLFEGQKFHFRTHIQLSDVCDLKSERGDKEKGEEGEGGEGERERKTCLLTLKTVSAHFSESEINCLSNCPRRERGKEKEKERENERERENEA